MIDIHTHILPGIDDGSSSTAESAEMLKTLHNQGVDTVIVTPHFYVDNMNTDEFLRKRDAAAKALKESSDGYERPRIALGAEVEFYNELYSLDILDKLCISGTRYILVEMPFDRWSDYTYQSLSLLSLNRGIIPIIAHIERYLDYQKENVIDRLMDSDALIQINSSFVIEKSSRRKALSMIKNGMICYLGSDCHNLDDRRPNIGEAYRIIQGKLGRYGLETFEYWENKLKEDLETF